jgi:hypothetical protein
MQSISLRSTEPVICLVHSVPFLKEFAKFSKTAKDRQVIWRAALGKTLPKLSKPLCHNPLPPVRKGRQSSKAAKLRQAAVQLAGEAPWVRVRAGFRRPIFLVFSRRSKFVTRHLVLPLIPTLGFAEQLYVLTLGAAV